MVARQGFCENVIRRDKTTLTFVMYENLEKRRVNSGEKLSPKTQQGLLNNSIEVMRARYKPDLKEFWLFNARVPLELLDDVSNAFAKLYWHPDKK